jgi:hypothetical protein
MRVFGRKSATIPNVPPMAAPSGIDAKRWAQRADELQFTQLANIRATAQNWRTGLAGLTSLLSVASIVVAPNLADKLDTGWLIGAGASALVGLLALLYGTWQAMSAAFGVPGDAVIVTGRRLRDWESQQAADGSVALRRARQATLIALGLLILTTVIVVAGAKVAPSPGPFVRIDSGSGSFCGHLAATDPGKIAVIGEDGTVHAVAITTVKSAVAATAC